MVQPETRLHRRVNAHLPGWVHAEKTNNPYRAAMPDFYYEGPGVVAWIEYKNLAAWPVRATTPVSVAKHCSKRTWPRQRIWLGRAHRNGVLAAVFFGVPGGVAVLDSPALWEREWLRSEMNLVSEAEAAGWLTTKLEGRR